MGKAFAAVVVLVGFMGCGGEVIGVEGAEFSTVSQRENASNSPWHHARLESKQGARISIDFTTHQEDVDYKPQSTVFADNVWINVSRADLDETSTVKVVMTNRDLFVGNENSGYIQHYSESDIPLTLTYAENGRFTVLLPQSLRIDAWGYGGVNRITQKVEVEVNGERQEDPIQQAHMPPYFNVDLSKSPAE
jgi:hypothetical protein